VGRPVFYRQRIRSQAASVQAKSLMTHLAGEIRSRREISPEEAWLVASDAMRFLERDLLDLAPGQIELPCIEGLNSHFRQARQDQPEKLVKLTVVAEEDASIVEEFGTRAMQQGRLARMIEEAYEQGALLPLAGLTKATREQMRVPRAVLAVERYLKGEDLTLIRRELAVSKFTWARWWRGFQGAAAGFEESAAVVSGYSGFPVHLVSGWQELFKTCRDHPAARERLGKPRVAKKVEAPVDEEDRLTAKLIEEHGYTPAAMRYQVTLLVCCNQNKLANLHFAI